jgi:hypothetical protein
MAPVPSFVACLIRAVGVLALSASELMDYLRSVGLPEGGGDLALELHDGALFMPQFLALRWLPKEAAEAIASLDQYLGSMSGPGRSSEWTTSALRSGKQWENARQLAPTSTQAHLIRLPCCKVKPSWPGGIAN